MGMSVVMNKLRQSFFCSMEGMVSVWRKEQSFRLEITACLLLMPAVLFLSVGMFAKLVLILLMLLLLAIELLNSAIEALVDRISPDIHPLSRFAKDASCAAVGVVILMNVTAWFWVIVFLKMAHIS